MMAAGSAVGRRVSDLTTPALLVDLSKVRANCNKMLATCQAMGVSLRAQTKTHKTIEGAELQTGGSRRGLVVSTLDEAEFYGHHGFDDILYGYPLIPHHMPRVTALTRRLDKFHVMVDSELAVETLKKTSAPPGKKWSVFLKVDCGNRRAGVWWEDEAGVELAVLLAELDNNITFSGVYVHCGNSYGTQDPSQVAQVRDLTIDRVTNFVGRVKGRGVTCPTVGIGSTPTCSMSGDAMKKLTELHPGNYVFYDVQQSTLGSCTMDEIACCVATRVIGHYSHRNQLLVDCGFMGLTKQGYGSMATGYGVLRGHPKLKLCQMTQEIGYVEPLEGRLDYDQFPINSLLYILPWHACATAAMHSVFYVVDGDTVVEEWRPTRGW